MLAHHVEVLTPRDQDPNSIFEGSEVGSSRSPSRNAGEIFESVREDEEERRPQSSPDILVLEEGFEAAAEDAVDEHEEEQSDQEVEKEQDEQEGQEEQEKEEEDVQETAREVREKEENGVNIIGKDDVMKRKMVHLITQFKKVKELLSLEKVRVDPNFTHSCTWKTVATSMNACGDWMCFIYFVKCSTCHESVISIASKKSHTPIFFTKG